MRVKKRDFKKILPNKNVYMKIFYDDFEVGDTIGYDENWDGRRTGRVIEKVLTEQLLSDIKRWETKENEHNMRIIKKQGGSDDSKRIN